MSLPAGPGHNSRTIGPLASEVRQHLEFLSLDQLKLPPGRGVRKVTEAEQKATCKSLTAFGPAVPVLVDGKRRVISGWATVLAARSLGWESLPCIVISHLSEAELRALKISIARIAELGVWDKTALGLEFKELSEVLENFDFEATGFTLPEIEAFSFSVEGEEEAEFSDLQPQRTAIARPGDLFRLGDHLLLCGALSAQMHRPVR